MKKRIKRLCIALGLYACFMGLLMLYSIRVLGYSSPKQTFKGLYAGFESVCFNIFQDFDLSKEISQLPQELTDTLHLEEWTIVQTSSSDIVDTLSLKQENLKNIVGLTDIDTKTVYLSANDAEAHFAFPHEIGHVVDYTFGWPSRSEEFRELYALEASSYADANYHQALKYATSSSYEYFASVFCDLILDNSENLSSVPRTVEFVKKYVTAY